MAMRPQQINNKVSNSTCSFSINQQYYYQNMLKKPVHKAIARLYVLTYYTNLVGSIDVDG